MSSVSPSRGVASDWETTHSEDVRCSANVFSRANLKIASGTLGMLQQRLAMETREPAQDLAVLPEVVFRLTVRKRADHDATAGSCSVPDFTGAHPSRSAGSSPTS